ncbi:hypothetical protein L1F30_06135 [Simiduia sp. 21SJ11W-1]|uniref:hypothetical protein n=1 Tax=Simiduia sp. 21SJ11W-1 TaxID=2909669 RepID=UPI00209E9CA1|nr:hypothetical protein [Simiduia sp. 21SJ11W-1]UTA49123.1 hypothetical protein L1F30_06135 [Simiduia sp. 21SJ11W-1]
MKAQGIRPNARIWRHAESFKEAAILCSKNNLIQPMAVNAALAIELYLKSLLSLNILNPSGVVKEFKAEPGHQFSSLINRIENHHKTMLFEELENISNEINWDSEFKKFDDAFVKIRYWYETNNAAPIRHEILNLAVDLGKAVLAMGNKLNA